MTRPSTEAPLTSDDVIDALVAALCRPGTAEKERALYREALRGLVRLAQAEQLARMQQDFDHATDPGRFLRHHPSTGKDGSARH